MKGREFTGVVRMLALAAALATVGCATRPFVIHPPSAPAGMAGYAEKLATLDDAGRGRALTRAMRQWKQSPTAANRARLGLAQAQWGYAGHAPAAAAENLDHALSDRNADWTAYDRAFLKLRLAQVRHVVAEDRRARSLSVENRKLREALAEAKRKLQAISEIEEKLGPSNP